MTKQVKITSQKTSEYTMKISRLTIDKLGVKLYDKVSAVVAELISNSYDADAEEVYVKLPLATTLASKDNKGNITEYGHYIEIIDTGHGMTPFEAQSYFLVVGSDRRKRVGETAAKSREKRRPVMGRKGIGKLAPFGICKTIEVISSGGQETESGYITSHFYLDYDEIVKESSEEIKLKKGNLDGTYKDKRGTTIRLSNFQCKRVPNSEVMHRQLAARFAFTKPDFTVYLTDISTNKADPETKIVDRLKVPMRDETVISVDNRPVITDDGTNLAVSGVLGMAKSSYQNEETAGVRIYARGKIVATTRDFEQPAGFTGEFVVRSYLVGEIHADWLDYDEGDDLIRSDRQGIIWDSDYGRALQKWGAEIIKEIGRRSEKPRRDSAKKKFMEKSDFKKLATSRFADQEIVDAAVDLAEKIGSFAAEDELENATYVDDLAEVILSVAPHKALMNAFTEFSNEIQGISAPIESFVQLFGKARIAEMATYSQIAAERVRIITELEKIVVKKTEEAEFQKLLAKASWLIEPTFTVITANQSLKTFATTFEADYYKKHNKQIILDIGDTPENKRPDFTLASIDQRLHVVEIKSSDHVFDDADYERLLNYQDAFDDYFSKNKTFAQEFSRKYLITIVAKDVQLKISANKRSYESSVEKKAIELVTWHDFLHKAKKAHNKFLSVRENAQKRC